jgi:hypothetical protein
MDMGLFIRGFVGVSMKFEDRIHYATSAQGHLLDGPILLCARIYRL